MRDKDRKRKLKTKGKIGEKRVERQKYQNQEGRYYISTEILKDGVSKKSPFFLHHISILPNSFFWMEREIGGEVA